LPIHTIDIQIDQRVDERFNSAISLLGSSETSARTGAIYAISIKLAMCKTLIQKIRNNAIIRNIRTSCYTTMKEQNYVCRDCSFVVIKLGVLIPM
jgi:hypothetical protein